MTLYESHYRRQQKETDRLRESVSRARRIGRLGRDIRVWLAVWGGVVVVFLVLALCW